MHPLVILHMTTPNPKRDTKLGAWKYYGRLKKIVYPESAPETKTDTTKGGEKKVEKVLIYGGVETAPIHLRKAASKGSALLDDIPQHSEAELLGGDGAWKQIQWAGKVGYVLAEFVHPATASPESEIVTVPRKELETIYDTLGDFLGLRG